MSGRPSFQMNYWIRTHGDTVEIWNRVETVDESTGRYEEETYSNTINTRAIFYNLRGYRRDQWEVGYRTTADYVGLFYSTLDGSINAEDVVFAFGEKMRVDEVIPRRYGAHVDYIEIFLRLGD